LYGRLYIFFKQVFILLSTSVSVTGWLPSASRSVGNRASSTGLTPLAINFLTASFNSGLFQTSRIRPFW